MKIKSLFVFSSILFLTSCGGGSGGNQGNTDSDNRVENACTEFDGNYYDTGFATGLKLKPGEMPSDILDAAIPACATGQFIFNGSCWDGVSFDDSSGEVAFTKANANFSILKPQTPLTDLMYNYAFKIHTHIDRCDVTDPRDSTPECTVWMGHYPSLYHFNAYTTYALQNWTQKITATSLIAQGTSSFKFRTRYGACFKHDGTGYNTYDWYTNGTMNLGGQTLKLPILKSTFLTLYPNAPTIECRINVTAPTWGVIVKCCGSHNQAAFRIPSTNSIF